MNKMSDEPLIFSRHTSQVIQNKITGGSTIQLTVVQIVKLLNFFSFLRAILRAFRTEMEKHTVHFLNTNSPTYNHPVERFEKQTK